ncbi:anthranilate phosphoribosyltransferase [Paenibacillus gansuensis]|uniref:Anthranilate phosphoribosyltransferase n=1 Tax=Paenibacillus gansuensis TaxID=306542 RepID=A0ABW5PF67_9BACL
MKQWIKPLVPGNGHSRHLSYDEAVAAAHAIARGEASEAQTASLLTALRIRGESSAEAGAFADVFRKYIQPYASFSDSVYAVEGVRLKSHFPVETVVSLLLASVGIPIVLQGGVESAPDGGYTAGELLTELGWAEASSHSSWEEKFHFNRIGFLRSEQVCPPLAQLRAVQRQIGIPTIAESVERMLNPLQSRTLVTGVKDRNEAEPCELFSKAGFQSAIFIQGMDGSENLPLHKSSMVRRVTEGVEQTMVVDPLLLGFRREPLMKRTKKQQMEIFLRILQGHDAEELEVEREHIILNTGMRLVWFERVQTYEEGFMVARQLLQRREGEKRLALLTGAHSSAGISGTNRKAN